MPCTAGALADGFCFSHSPAMAAKRAAARRAGGLRRSGQLARVVLDAGTPPPELQTPDAVRLLLADTIGHIRTGRLDCRIGATVGQLAGVLLRALEQGELADRLAAVELSLAELTKDKGL